VQLPCYDFFPVNCLVAPIQKLALKLSANKAARYLIQLSTPESDGRYVQSFVTISPRYCFAITSNSSFIVLEFHKTNQTKKIFKDLLKHIAFSLKFPLYHRCNPTGKADSHLHNDLHIIRTFIQS